MSKRNKWTRNNTATSHASAIDAARHTLEGCKAQGTKTVLSQIRLSRGALIDLCILFIVTLLGFVTDDALVGMLVAIAQAILLFVHAKLSFFSIFPALLTFCLFQEYAAISGFEVYGVLDLGVVPYYFSELKFCVYSFNLFAMLIVLFTGVLDKERELLRIRFGVSDRASILFVTLAVIITVLIFPSLPNFSSFDSGNRFSSGILPFTGWSIVPFFLLSTAMGNAKNRITGVIASAFVIVWYAFHGERVETLGFIVLLAVKYYAGNSERRGTMLRLAAAAVIIVPVFVAIGSLRAGSVTLDFGELLHSIAIQSTACDVTYVFNCAVDLYYRGIQLDGGTYLSYLVNCVPLLKDPYAFATVIEQYYFTPGGGLFFAEAIANFGFMFSAVFSLAYLGLISAVISRGSTWSYLIYSTLVICIFRSAWYGLNYPITTVVYFVPFALIASRLLGNPRRSSLLGAKSANEGGLRANGRHSNDLLAHE